MLFRGRLRKDKKDWHVDKSNTYIIVFASILVLVSALLLSGVSEWLKPMIKVNEKEEKQSNILKTAGITDFADLQTAYSEHVKELIISDAGQQVESETQALLIDLNKDKRARKRDESFEMQYPLYEVTKDGGEKVYVMQMSGLGLWGPIWGYIGLDDNLEQVVGTVFDHKTETPGLGAEIAVDWFEEQFKGKKIFDAENDFVGICVCKKSNKDYADDNRVDAISGATITGDGVTDMLQEDLAFYLNYFKNQDS